MKLFSSFQKVFLPKESKTARPQPQRKIIKKQEPAPAKVDLSAAQAKAREIIIDAKDEALRIRRGAEEESRRLREELAELQRQLTRTEAHLEERQSHLQKRQEELERLRAQIEENLNQTELLKKEQLEKLEQVSKLTKDEASKTLFAELDKELAEQMSKRIREAEERAKEDSEEKAREILIDSMRLGATDYVAEYSVSTVKLPDDEMKGRIIGKEGRNIRSLERATGVDIDLDETPGEVRLSSFDPVRREVAKVALMRLIADGRIQPSRIEEFVTKARNEIDRVMFEEGRKLCHAVKVYNLPRDIVQKLGHFKYRFSYGQNMISHTLEETKIGIKLAHEVGADVDTVRLGCLLHDIGKIITDEEGSHVELGVKFLKQYNIPQSVVDCVAQHHEDEPISTKESALVYIADAISGSRPGARYENYEEYVKRLTTLEELATSYKGVKEAYAIQAGREVRVIVEPKEVSDQATEKIAHDLKVRIEKEMTYPGTVKVTVVREVRASDVAK